MHALQSRLITDAAMTLPGNLVSNELTGNSRNRRLARSVDIGHDYAVGLVERFTEFLLQRFRPRIPMRLKHGEHTIASDGFRCLERGFDLGRMMPVIVHEQKPIAVVFNFKAAAGMLKLS